MKAAIKRGMLVACAATLLAGIPSCGGSGSTPAATTNTPTATSDPCAVTPGGPPGPVNDPSGPYFHQVVVARTADGLNLTDLKQVLDHASVPDGVRNASGGVFVYYVNGAAGSVWVAQTDGATATPLGPIALNGVSAPAGVVDPDATLVGAKIRLAYLSGFSSPTNPNPRAMCLADSSDGVNFTVVGAALKLAASETITDPSLARLDDGSWLMAMSKGQQTVLARSNDGLTFATYDTVNLGGVPEISGLPGGRVRLYVCAQGIVSYVSADGGRTWSFEQTVAPPGTLGKKIVCDPSWVPDAGLFVLKTGN